MRITCTRRIAGQQNHLLGGVPKEKEHWITDHEIPDELWPKVLAIKRAKNGRKREQKIYDWDPPTNSVQFQLIPLKTKFNSTCLNHSSMSNPISIDLDLRCDLHCDPHLDHHLNHRLNRRLDLRPDQPQERPQERQQLRQDKNASNRTLKASLMEKTTPMRLTLNRSTPLPTRTTPRLERGWKKQPQRKTSNKWER